MSGSGPDKLRAAGERAAGDELRAAGANARQGVRNRRESGSGDALCSCVPYVRRSASGVRLLVGRSTGGSGEARRTWREREPAT